MNPSLSYSHLGKVLLVELNRPKALNSLSIDMCVSVNDLLSNQLHNYGAFILKGVGNKAFCAGGDVKSIWQELINLEKESKLKELGTGQDGYLHSDFFRTEYKMNYLLGSSHVPQISFLNGIVMGGGVGISVHGRYRVATEKTLFAMPETGNYV